MNYATGCALNGNELMESLDIKRIKTHWTKCKEISGRPSKTSFAVTIFTKALQLAMEDVIDNSVTFELPKGTNNANIYIKEFISITTSIINFNIYGSNKIRHSLHIIVTTRIRRHYEYRRKY